MDTLHKDYVYLDGKWLKAEDVLLMAISAGSMTIAEHYLCAYLTNAVINGNTDAVAQVNEVRMAYNLKPIPDTDNKGKGKSAPCNETRADLARKKFKDLSADKKESLLKDGMKELQVGHQSLFKSKVDWNGIYLVVRDRLDGNIRKSDFPNMARKMSPEDWPADLMIADTTMTNFAHYVDISDRQEAYYDMQNNPWKDLCYTFWDILETLILTSN